MCLEVRMHCTVGRVIEMVSDGVVCYTELLSLPVPPFHTSPLAGIGVRSEVWCEVAVGSVARSVRCGCDVRVL